MIKYFLRNKELGSICVFLSCFVGQVEAQIDSLQRIEEIVVTGSRSAVDVRHLPMTVTVINREQLSERHSTSVLPTVMELVPGMFVTSRAVLGYGVSNGSAGGITLRGISGGAGQMLVLVDGHPQYQGIYGHPIADSYQTMMAERVEILRGPASVLYGSNAMGGVINIVTRSNHEDGIINSIDVGAGSYGTVQVEASNKIRKGKFSSVLSGQYSRTDNHRPRMGFEQYGGYLKLGYDINEHWKTYLDADITHFNASYPGSVDNPLYNADQWITRGVVSTALENHYKQTNGAISVYCNFGRHKIDDGTSDVTKPTNRFFRSKDALTGVTIYQSAQMFDGNRITVGVDYQHIYGNAYYTSKEDGSVLDTPNKQSGRSYRNEIAGYVDFRQDVTDWLTLDAGIRLDHHSISGTEWVPQAGIVVRPMGTGEIKGMVSKGFRNPTMRELYLYPPSNEDLEPERIWNYELSWKQRIGTFCYGANLYYLKGDNMIQTIERKNVNIGKIENYGVEMEASYQINKKWGVSTNHSLLHMKNIIVAAPKYKGYLEMRYHNTRWNVLTGLQYINSLYTSVGTEETKVCFLLLNVAIDYSLTNSVKLWAKGENLLAQKYEINYGYPMPRATILVGINSHF